MPKKIRFEAFKYRLLVEGERNPMLPSSSAPSNWVTFIEGLEFKYDTGEIIITHPRVPDLKEHIILNKPLLYRRGDNDIAIKKQRNVGLLYAKDSIQTNNEHYFSKILQLIGEQAGFELNTPANDRIELERQFHNAWAASADLSKVDVRKVNEACTAPEMRFITKRLGNVKGKSVLDIGCGLGEVSVYFATLGAKVTASDLSPGMCDCAKNLATLHNVEIKTHVASSESIGLADTEKFDIIYAGNVLHHVNINETMLQILPHLKDNGQFVSWDPVAYNPIINVYRWLATKVRTKDEHPLKRSDVTQLCAYFGSVETRFYWLTTLIIFVIMALIQRRNPNKERYWKSVIHEASQWAWLYKPLERFDRVLMKMFPSMKWLCWNMVLIARNPKHKKDY